MGESSRRRGSVQDVVDEDPPRCTDRGRNREYSALPHKDLPRPRHHSRWSSREEKDDTDVKDKVDMAGTKELLHNSGCYRSMSPAFDGLKQEKWSNTPDKQGSHSNRYGERRRSRGLEKSRSRSPGWSRSRKRARDWSRSRSRSRSKGRIRGPSRSPFYDQGPESHQLSDRESRHGRSSQTCKDFVSGMCRRGSQCRFVHSDNPLRDDEPLDSGIAGRWKGKQELGHGSKYHSDKTAYKFSDAHYGDDVPSRSRPRGAVICRDFVKGNCRYGESCRFSHSAENDNAERTSKTVPVDPDHGHNSNKSGRSLCKFFLAGDCRRDNCRYSHGTPPSSELQDRVHDKSGGETVVTLNEWKRTLWDEPEKPEKTRQISKWGASVDADIHDKSGGETVVTLNEWKGTLWDEPEKPEKTRRISKWGASVDADIHDKSGGETVVTLNEWKGTLWDEPEKPEKTRRISKWGASVDADIHDKSGGETVVTLNEWKGPLWDEPEKPEKTRRISKWGASVDADMDLSEDVSVGRRGDDGWGSSSLEDDTKAWEHDDKGLNRHSYHSNSRTNDANSRHMVAAKTMVIQNSPGEPQKNLTCKEFRSHDKNKLAPHIPSPDYVGEAGQHYLSSPSANPHLSMTSSTHPHQELEGHNTGPVLESGILHELKDCRNSIGQSFNTETRSVSCDTAPLLNMKGQQMPLPISNSLKVNLNGSGQVVFPSNVNEHINHLQSTIQQNSEASAHSSFPVLAPDDQCAPLHTLPIPVSNIQNIPAVHVANELKPQPHTVLDPSTLMGIAPSQSLRHPVPADCPQDVSNSIRSLDHHPLLKNDTVYPASDEKTRELLSSLSVVNPQLSTLHHSDSRIEGNDDSKENLHITTKKLEVNDNGEKFHMSSKVEAGNYCSNRADDQGKEEGDNNNKDEKEMRLFKNALVELVKDILKPKWKEGKMSREVHKTVVKKVVDKVTVTIQAEQVPKTQEKIEQYLSTNGPKISKLVQAYVERSLKAGS